MRTAVDVETLYQIRVTCREAQEGMIRTILLRHINSVPGMTIQRISTQEIGENGQAAVVADVYSVERKDRAIQDVMSGSTSNPMSDP